LLNLDWSQVTDSRDYGILEQLALADERATETAKKLGFEETVNFSLSFKSLVQSLCTIQLIRLFATAFCGKNKKAFL
jgi:AraC-like DNA-binding protein